MSDYPLNKLAKIVDGPGDRKGTGMMIDCPNCGVPGGVWFANPLDGGPPVHPTVWQRTGDTPDVMSLTPSVKMFDHFHSWVRNGMLCVDSPFECQRKEIMTDEQTPTTPTETPTPAPTEPTPPAPVTPPALALSERLIKMAETLEPVAVDIYTPGVSNSDYHARVVRDVANALRKLAGELDGQ